PPRAVEPVIAASVEPAPPEADTSSEWESMLSVEHVAAAEMEAVPIRQDAPEPAVVEDAEETGGTGPCYAAAEKIQEIRFFISQQMWDEAKKAILDLTEISPDSPEITELIAAVSAGRSRADVTVAAQPAATQPVAAQAKEFAITP